MKPVTILLAVLLAVLLLLAALTLTGVLELPRALRPSSNLPSFSYTPAQPSASAEPETEPEPELLVNDWRFVLNGTDVETRLLDGEGAALVLAEDFLRATALDTADCAWAADRARIDYADGSFTLDGAPCGLTCAEGCWLPLEELAQALAYPVWEDSENRTTYISPAARSFALPENVDVPVLMYHAVSDNLWGIDELFLSPTSMEAQLRYLTEQGYDCIWFEDLAHIEDYDKPVILTFDDGYDDNYTQLFPLLRKYQVKATVFIITDSLGSQHKLTQEQVREMADSGLVSIQSHSVTHGDLSRMDAATLEYELGQSSRDIARLTGRIPYVLCYPSGKHSELTVEIAAKHYNFALQMGGSLYNTDDDPLRIRRFYIYRGISLDTFAAYLAAAGG